MRRKLMAAVLLTLLVPFMPAVSGRSAADTSRNSSDRASAEELSALWWQWIAAITEDSPVLPNSTNCEVGNKPFVRVARELVPAFFLAGTFTITPVKRSCTIPLGTPVFLPVINGEISLLELDPGSTLADAQAAAVKQANAFTGHKALLDGRPIPVLRLFVPQFPIDWVDGNAYLLSGHTQAAADGYYVLIPHLSRGRHTLHVFGYAPAFAFSQDITYTLDVRPVPREVSS
jgi:hypothetical protein